jgi:hypothetical protein
MVGMSEGALGRALERLRKGPFARILENPQAYRLQVLLTDCEARDGVKRKQPGGEGEGSVEDWGAINRQGFRCDEEYFYPASTVKLCVAVAALHILDRLKEEDKGGAASALREALDTNTPLVFKYREKKGFRRTGEGPGEEKDAGSSSSKTEGGEIVLEDDETNAEGCAITLGHLIRNVFLVSSNGAFNLLLDFVGRQTLALFLEALGFKHFRVRDYFQDEDFGPRRNWTLLGLEILLPSSPSPSSSSTSNKKQRRLGVRCGDLGFSHLLLAHRDSDKQDVEQDVAPGMTEPEPEAERFGLFEDYSVGSSHISNPGDWDWHCEPCEPAEESPPPPQQEAKENEKKIIEKSGRTKELLPQRITTVPVHHKRPKDFSAKQQASLVELQDLLMLVVRPDLDRKKKKKKKKKSVLRAPLVLTHESRAFLLETMAMKTTESENPKYSPPKYFSSWNKFFLPGIVNARQRRSGKKSLGGGLSLRVYNKLGQAYGFSLDNAYVEDAETGRSFFLTACLYTNRNGVLNDNRYEYESVAEPFLSQLAEACCLELQAPSV